MTSLLPRATGKRFYGVHLRPYNPKTGVRDQYVTNAHRFITEPTDTPPNQPFMARLLGGLLTDRAVSSGGKLGGATTLEYSSLRLANHDGVLDSWSELIWGGREAKIKVGELDQPWERWEEVYTGVIEAVHIGSRTEVVVKLRGKRAEFEKPFLTSSYLGLGGGLEFNTSPTVQYGEIAPAPGFDLTGPVTIEFIGEVFSYPTAHAGFLSRMVNFGGGRQWTLELRPDGRIRFLTTNPVVALTAPAAHSVPLNQLVHVTATSDGVEGKLFLNGTEIKAGPFPPLVSTPSSGLYIGHAAAPLNARFDTVRLWNARIPDDELKDLLFSSYAELSDARLISYWKFDGFGTTVHDEKGKNDFTLVGGPEWTTGYEGDDPHDFEGSVSGQPKPAVIGRVYSIPPKLVNAQQKVYQHHDYKTFGAANSQIRVFSDGVPLVPELARSSSQLEIDGNAKTITTPSPDFLESFIPGQTAPPREGQRIRIQGGKNHGRVFEIAPEGINGAVLTLVENQGDTLLSESNVLGQTLGAPSSDAQVQPRLSRGAFQLITAPAGDITADIRGWTSNGFHSVSAVVQLLTGISPDDSTLSFDPAIGIYLTAGETVKALMDELMKSCFGWWIFDRAGNFMIGNFEDPQNETPTIFLDDRKIISLRGLPTVSPNWKVSVGWRKNWSIPKNLAGSVSISDRQLYSDTYRVVSASDKTVKQLYLDSTELPQVNTSLVHLSDAQTLARRLLSLFGRQRQHYQIVAKTESLLDVDLNQVLELTYPRFGLSEVKCRVLRIQQDASKGETSLEIVRWLS